VDRLIDKAISFSYGDAEIYDFIPSFAHVEGHFPLLEDKFPECTFGNGLIHSSLLHIIDIHCHQRMAFWKDFYRSFAGR